jgi:hypothetical protein
MNNLKCVISPGNDKPTSSCCIDNLKCVISPDINQQAHALSPYNIVFVEWYIINDLKCVISTDINQQAHAINILVYLQ